MAPLRFYGSPSCFDGGFQLTCIVGSVASRLPLLYGVQARQVVWPIEHSNTKPVTSSFGTVGRCKVLLDKEISISKKHRSILEGVLKCPGRWLH